MPTTADTFNMRDLSDEVATEFGLSKQAGADQTRFVFERIKENLAQGRQVRLHRFGTLKARLRPAGPGRNPKTGEKIQVPARMEVKLTPSPALKELL